MRTRLVAATLFAAVIPNVTLASEASTEPMFRVVSPVGQITAKTTAMAPRLGTLDGKTIALVWNRSFKSDVTLPAIGEALRKRYPGVAIIPYHAMPMAPLPESPETSPEESDALQAAFLAKRCDAVIVGNGG